MKKYLKQLKANKKGFTLIEMIVVIAIIGILAAILVPSMTGYLRNARASKEDANARTVYTAAQAAVTALESEISIANDTYKKPNTNTGTDNTSKLFKKIEELIGTGNYTKFAEIEVKVTNGAVEKVLVKENSTDVGASYPKS